MRRSHFFKDAFTKCVHITGEKKQIPIIGYFRVFKEYLYKSKIWQSETSPNQGIPNQVPWLGLLWVFLNTLKYPKMEICYFFLCIRKFLELHCGHKNSISLDSDLPKKINACPQCVWSHWTLSHSSWYFKTLARSDTRSFADH